ncbi:MAG: PDZ domain-containing protein [Planctomycetota bacterium]
MKKHIVFISVMFGAVIALCSQSTMAGRRQGDVTETMKQSIVYLETSFYGYEPSQPWRHKDLTENWACGCAVGEYEVLTTAWAVANLAYVKALRYGQNEFVGAKIKVIDYESNLCLIELDPNALSEPLKPLVFTEDYRKGAEVDFYWLSSDNRLYNGRGYLDRAIVRKTNTSYEKRLHYLAANTSHRTGAGQVYCVDSEPIGIAFWSNDRKESSLVPAETINRFLAAVARGGYEGFGSVGFTTSALLDPSMRSFLKIPASLKAGAYVTDVYNLGTGGDVLKQADVVLAINGNALNSYGQFIHPKYELLDFHQLITSKTAGEKVLFELWRDGEKIQVRSEVKNFKASEMLVPYHEYDKQPEYIITGGFILQKLTREYLAEWGDDWAGKVSPQFYHHYRYLSFKPTPERSDIVILSYVLPANINLGYSKLGQIVVKKYNGMTIRSVADILTAQKLNPESKYDVIEFEMDNPAVVIPREQLPAADMFIRRNYGIQKLKNVNL